MCELYNFFVQLCNNLRNERTHLCHTCYCQAAAKVFENRRARLKEFRIFIATVMILAEKADKAFSGNNNRKQLYATCKEHIETLH
jgi:hypothetical protein